MNEMYSCEPLINQNSLIVLLWTLKWNLKALTSCISIIKSKELNNNLLVSLNADTGRGSSQLGNLSSIEL